MTEELVVRVTAEPGSLFAGLEPDDWAHTYLHALQSPASLGNITKAAHAAGVSRGLVHKRAGNDVLFKAYCQAIEDAITDAVEAAYIRLITEGSSRGVYQRGKLMETITEWDPKAMQWWLERKRPEEYHLPTRIELVQSGADSEGGFTFRMGDRSLVEDAEFEDVPEALPENSP